MRIFATTISLLMCLAIASPQSAGEVVYLCSTAPSPNGVMEAKGSAVCVGRTGGKSVLLTAKHNLEGMHKVWVQSDSDWVECQFIAAHPTEDVALLETPARFTVSLWRSLRILSFHARLKALGLISTTSAKDRSSGVACVVSCLSDQGASMPSRRFRRAGLLRWGRHWNCQCGAIAVNAASSSIESN